MNEPKAAASPAQAIQSWISDLGDVEPLKTETATPPQQQEQPNGPNDTPQEPAPAPVGTPTAGSPVAAPAQAAPAKPEPQPAAAAPPEAAKPAEDLPEDKWPRTAQEWKKFKESKASALKERDEKIKALESERDQIRQKIAAPPTTDPEFDAVKKERDDLSERLRLLDVERHPRFVAHFQTRINGQVELAKSIVGEQHAATAAKLLVLPDGDYKNAQIEELMVNLSPLQQSRFGGVLNALAGIEAERQSEISRARENYESMTAEQKAAKDKQVKALEKTFADFALKAQETNPVFKKREGDHAWNSGVEKRLETARNLFFGNNVKAEQVIEAALNAAALPEILIGYDALHAENEKLKAQVAELSKSSPTIQSKEHPADGTPQPIPIKHGMRPDDATNAWVRSLTAE